jgi:hypothetical protein
MIESRNVVRLEYMLGVLIFRVTMAPIYGVLKCELGPTGMIVSFSDDDVPFASLRLLQVCRVGKFGHIISSVSSDNIRLFTTTRVVVAVFYMKAV